MGNLKTRLKNKFGVSLFIEFIMLGVLIVGVLTASVPMVIIPCLITGAMKAVSRLKQDVADSDIKKISNIFKEKQQYLNRIPKGKNDTKVYKVNDVEENAVVDINKDSQTCDEVIGGRTNLF